MKKKRKIKRNAYKYFNKLLKNEILPLKNNNSIFTKLINYNIKLAINTISKHNRGLLIC